MLWLVLYVNIPWRSTLVTSHVSFAIKLFYLVLYLYQSQSSSSVWGDVMWLTSRGRYKPFLTNSGAGCISAPVIDVYGTSVVGISSVSQWLILDSNRIIPSEWTATHTGYWLCFAKSKQRPIKYYICFVSNPYSTTERHKTHQEQW